MRARCQAQKASTITFNFDGVTPKTVSTWIHKTFAIKLNGTPAYTAKELVKDEVVKALAEFSERVAASKMNPADIYKAYLYHKVTAKKEVNVFDMFQELNDKGYSQEVFSVAKGKPHMDKFVTMYPNAKQLMETASKVCQSIVVVEKNDVLIAVAPVRGDFIDYLSVARMFPDVVMKKYCESAIKLGNFYSRFVSIEQGVVKIGKMKENYTTSFGLEGILDDYSRFEASVMMAFKELITVGKIDLVLQKNVRGVGMASLIYNLVCDVMSTEAVADTPEEALMLAYVGFNKQESVDVVSRVTKEGKKVGYSIRLPNPTVPNSTCDGVKFNSRKKIATYESAKAMLVMRRNNEGEQDASHSNLNMHYYANVRMPYNFIKNAQLVTDYYLTVKDQPDISIYLHNFTATKIRMKMHLDSLIAANYRGNVHVTYDQMTGVVQPKKPYKSAEYKLVYHYNSSDLEGVVRVDHEYGVKFGETDDLKHTFCSALKGLVQDLPKIIGDKHFIANLLLVPGVNDVIPVDCKVVASVESHNLQGFFSNVPAFLNNLALAPEVRPIKVAEYAADLAGTRYFECIVHNVARGQYFATGRTHKEICSAYGIYRPSYAIGRVKGVQEARVIIGGDAVDLDKVKGHDLMQYYDTLAEEFRDSIDSNPAALEKIRVAREKSARLAEEARKREEELEKLTHSSDSNNGAIVAARDGRDGSIVARDEDGDTEDDSDDEKTTTELNMDKSNVEVVEDEIEI